MQNVNSYKIKPFYENKFSKIKKLPQSILIEINLAQNHIENMGHVTMFVFAIRLGFCLSIISDLELDEKADVIAGEVMAEKYQTKPSSCKPYIILCGHKGIYPDGKIRQIPEYETSALFVPNLGIYDSDIIAKWNDLCKELGLDTISTVVTISYLMEATEKKVIKHRFKIRLSK